VGSFNPHVSDGCEVVIGVYNRLGLISEWHIHISTSA
jgi:hypothetical protein